MAATGIAAIDRLSALKLFATHSKEFLCGADQQDIMNIMPWRKCQCTKAK